MGKGWIAGEFEKHTTSLRDPVPFPVEFVVVGQGEGGLEQFPLLLQHAVNTLTKKDWKER